MTIDWTKAIEKGEKFLNSLPPKGKVVVLTTLGVATTIVAIPPACKSVTKLAYEFPKMAESINKGLTTLKQGTSDLITDEVYEAQIVDGEAAA